MFHQLTLSSRETVAVHSAVQPSSNDRSSARPLTDTVDGNTADIPRWQYLRDKAVEQRKQAPAATAPDRAGSISAVRLDVPAPPPPSPPEEHPNYWADQAHNLYSEGTVKQREKAYKAVMAVDVDARKAKHDELAAAKASESSAATVEALGEGAARYITSINGDVKDASDAGGGAESGGDAGYSEQNPSFWADKAYNVAHNGGVMTAQEAFTAVMETELEKREAKYNEIADAVSVEE